MLNSLSVDEKAVLLDRLFDRIIEVTDSDCWVVGGWKRAGDYGGIKLRNKSHLAHRISYELHRGEIPTGLVVMHSCDNPPCINPDHLSIGTVADNNWDRERKGRGKHPSGPAHYLSQRTHCSRGGHPLSGDNLYVHPSGKRRCRTCQKGNTYV